MLPFFASAVLNGLPADAVKVPPFNYLKLFLSIGITTSTWQTRWIQGIEKSSQKTAHTHTAPMVKANAKTAKQKPGYV